MKVPKSPCSTGIVVRQHLYQWKQPPLCQSLKKKIRNPGRVSNKPAHGQDRPALSIIGPWGPHPMTPRGLKRSNPPRPDPEILGSLPRGPRGRTLSVPLENMRITHPLFSGTFGGPPRDTPRSKKPTPTSLYPEILGSLPSGPQGGTPF